MPANRSLLSRCTLSMTGISSLLRSRGGVREPRVPDGGLSMLIRRLSRSAAGSTRAAPRDDALVAVAARTAHQQPLWSTRPNALGTVGDRRLLRRRHPGRRSVSVERSPGRTRAPAPGGVRDQPVGRCEPRNDGQEPMRLASTVMTALGAPAQQQPVVRRLLQAALGGGLLFAGTGHLTFARTTFRAQVPTWFPIGPRPRRPRLGGRRAGPGRRTGPARGPPPSGSPSAGWRRRSSSRCSRATSPSSSPAPMRSGSTPTPGERCGSRSSPSSSSGHCGPPRRGSHGDAVVASRRPAPRSAPQARSGRCRLPATPGRAAAGGGRGPSVSAGTAARARRPRPAARGRRHPRRAAPGRRRGRHPRPGASAPRRPGPRRSPWATIASTRASLPPSATSSAVKPARCIVLV